VRNRAKDSQGEVAKGILEEQLMLIWNAWGLAHPILKNTECSLQTEIEVGRLLRCEFCVTLGLLWSLATLGPIPKFRKTMLFSLPNSLRNELRSWKV
jgi:hypothetical protein